MTVEISGWEAAYRRRPSDTYGRDESHQDAEFLDGLFREQRAHRNHPPTRPSATRCMTSYSGGVPMKKDGHPLVQLARRTIEAWVREGRVIEPPDSLSPEMAEQAGAFVSLHHRGQLRGCIGTLEPVKASVAEEVIGNAIVAATRDPRFPSLRTEELRDLEVKVDILTPPEPISGLAELDPKRYGVVVQCGLRRGLLLPDLEEVDTVEYQVSIARRKAGIGPDEPVQLYRFEVKRYT